MAGKKQNDCVKSSDECLMAANEMLIFVLRRLWVIVNMSDIKHALTVNMSA